MWGRLSMIEFNLGINLYSLTIIPWGLLVVTVLTVAPVKLAWIFWVFVSSENNNNNNERKSQSLAEKKRLEAKPRASPPTWIFPCPSKSHINTLKISKSIIYSITYWNKDTTTKFLFNLITLLDLGHMNNNYNTIIRDHVDLFKSSW